MKKLSKGAIALIVVCASFFLLLNISVIFNVFAARWRHAVDFERYANDFRCMADIVLAEYEDVGYRGDERMVFTIGRYSNDDYFIAEHEVILELDDKQQTSMNNVIAAYPYEYSYPSEIVAYENRVSFHITSGKYVLVYTVDGSEPTFAAKPTEDENIRVKRINENWFHVAAE